MECGLLGYNCLIKDVNQAIIGHILSSHLIFARWRTLIEFNLSLRTRGQKIVKHWTHSKFLSRAHITPLMNSRNEQKITEFITVNPLWIHECRLGYEVRQDIWGKQASYESVCTRVRENFRISRSLAQNIYTVIYLISIQFLSPLVICYITTYTYT